MGSTDLKKKTFGELESIGISIVEICGMKKYLRMTAHFLITLTGEKIQGQEPFRGKA